MTSTAILLIGYRRSHELGEILSRVCIYGLPVIISLDGAAEGNCKLYTATRKIADYFSEKYDYVEVWARKENKGLAIHITESISMVTSKYEQVIVIEDDCIPMPGLIEYFLEMLSRYKNDLRVFSVAGSAFLPEAQIPTELVEQEDYFFSRFTHIWGWATWRDRWQQYDLRPRDLKTFLLRYDNLGFSSNEVEKRFWKETLISYYDMSSPSSWDFQWSYVHFKNSALCAVPFKSYIKNVGTTLGTHVSSIAEHNRRAFSPSFPIRHCRYVVANSRIERQIFLTAYNGKAMEGKEWPGKQLIRDAILFAQGFEGKQDKE